MDNIVTLTSLSNSLPLAPERWTVEQKRRNWEEELQQFREKQRKKLKNIRLNSQKKVSELHEKIFTTMRWSIPVLPSTYCKLVFEYCDHLMGPFPETPFPKWNVLVAWQIKFECSPEAKVTTTIQQLLEKLNRIVLKRDEHLVKTIVHTEEKAEKLTIANEGKIKWHMETMHNRRDDYWTIWYLSKNGKIDELKRFLSSFQNIDEVDPDFGYTALHYACRWNQSEVFDLLLNNGASIFLTVPEDHRTPLHLASAYGTREMVLELLARGADYSGVDDHGFTALDLATQNHNHPVVQTLKNWVHLIPPEETVEEAVEEGNYIPEEYLSTPYEVLLTMSPPLRVITTRLEGVGKKHSLEVDLPLEVELRLCEKRADMCFAEGFKKEALKSKKRMWSSVKREYLKPEQGKRGDEDGENGDGDKQDKDTQQNDQSQRQPGFSLNPSYMSSICLNLYSFLMQEKDYLTAEKILSDGLITLQHDRERGRRERVKMLTRYCELLMYHYDRRISNKQSQERFEEFIDENEVRYGDLERGEYVVVDETKKNPTTERVVEMTEEEAVEFIASNVPTSCLSPSTMSMFPSLQQQQPQQPHHHHQQISNSLSLPNILSPEFNSPTQFSLPSLHQSFLQSEDSFRIPTQTFPDTTTFEPPSHKILLKRIEKCLTEGIELIKIIFKELDSFIESVELAPMLELMSECLDRMSKYEDALHYRLHAATVKERILGQDHPETVSSLIESLRLTIRKDLVIANKHIHELEVERELEKLKLSKYALAHYVDKPIGMQPEDRKNFALIGLQATEVSRRLDKLIQMDQESAIRLSGKCYQLVALTDLIVAGELDPTTANTTPKEISRKSSQQPKQSAKKKEPKKTRERNEDGRGIKEKSLSLGSLKYLKSPREFPTPTVNLKMDVLNYSLFEESRLNSTKK